jgi:hypothetical protein
VPTWLVGVTAGVLLRTAVLGHWYVKELTFLLVALVFVGLVAFVARFALRAPLAAFDALWHHRGRSR